MKKLEISQKPPFQPGVGKEPPLFAGREKEMAEFARMLDELSYNPRNLTVLGLRGVGKSVVSKHFMQQAKAKKVVAIRRQILPSFTNQAEFELCVLKDAHDALLELSKGYRFAQAAGHALQGLLQTVQVSLQVATAAVHGMPITVALSPGMIDEIGDPNQPFVDRLASLYRKIGEVAQVASKGVIFILDEAQFARSRGDPKAGSLAQLLHCIGEVQEDNLPVGLVLVGLPPLAEVVEASSSHSERFLVGSVLVGSLPHEAAVEALVQPAIASGLPFAEGVAEKIAHDCGDYAYFLQAYGDGVWRQAKDSGKLEIGFDDYAAALGGIQLFLDRTFFDHRFAKVPSGTDRLVLCAMGGFDNEAIPLREVVDRLHGVVGRNMVDQTVLRLIDNEVVFRQGWGMLTFTAPQFSNYLDRKHPLEEELKLGRKSQGRGGLN